MSWWGPQPFQVNSFKNCKNGVRKSVSKRQVESLKKGVTGYIVPRTTSESHVIENALLNTDIARKADSRMVISWFENGDEQSIILLWNSAFCFGITSHPSTKHASLLSLCCFEINKCLTFFFRQNILIKLQHAIKANQSWRLKVFWLQKWLYAWKWHEVTKQFWTHTFWNWTTHHIAKF